MMADTMYDDADQMYVVLINWSVGSSERCRLPVPLIQCALPGRCAAVFIGRDSRLCFDINGVSAVDWAETRWGVGNDVLKCWQRQR